MLKNPGQGQFEYRAQRGRPGDMVLADEGADLEVNRTPLVIRHAGSSQSVDLVIHIQKKVGELRKQKL